MAFDPELGGVVLFGGYNGTALNETWVFRSGSWTNLTNLSPSAPPGGTSELTYDPAIHALVQIGLSGSTWTYSNETWSSVATSPRPSTGGGEAVFYDPTLGAVIVAGGSVGQTWAFANGSWARLYPATELPSRTPTSLPVFESGYDTALGYGMAYGPEGWIHGSYYDNSTWFFRNDTWTNVTSTLGSAPPAGGVATGASVAYDSTDGEFVLYWAETSYVPPVDKNETWLLSDPFSLTATESATRADVGQNVSYSLNVSGGVRPYPVSFGSLPPGCPNSTNLPNESVIVCTLASPGNFAFQVSVGDLNDPALSVTLWIDVARAPSLSWSFAPSPTTAGVPVTFTSNATGGFPPYAYAWAFGDGSGANTSTATHAYASPADFMVSGQVTDAVGYTARVNSSLRVNPSPQVVATVSRSVTDVGLPLQFTASLSGGTTPLSAAWSLGDGTTATGTSFTHQYALAGTFAPRVWTNDSVGATATSSVTVRVNPALSVNATANTSHTFVGSPVAFTTVFVGGTAPFAVSWDFGDGERANGSSVSHDYGNAGRYTAHASVNDSVGASKTVLVSIEVTPPTNGTGVPPPNRGSGEGYALSIVLGSAGGGAIGGIVLGVVLGRRWRRSASVPDSAATE